MKRLFGYLCVLFFVFFMLMPVCMDGGISVDAGGEMIVSTVDMDCACEAGNTTIESYFTQEGTLSYISEAVYEPNCRDVQASTKTLIE